MTYKQLLASEKVFDASGITNPWAFEWKEVNGVYYPIDFNVISLSVYKFPLGDCTNGGVSGGDTKDVYIPCESGPFTAFKVDQSLILFPEHRGTEYWALKPAYSPSGMCGPMYGGNLAYSSDSRVRRVYHIHDRFETPEVNKMLSI
jgi:hypothetical protein